MNALFYDIIAFAACMIVSVSAHGRLLEPPSRSSLFRFAYSDPMLIPYRDIIQPNYNDNELYCGGRDVQIKNDGKCGVCGDSYTAPVKDNEAGGKYALGIITRNYQQGQVIDITVEITAAHKGYFEFRLCPWNDIHTPVTHECLNENLLTYENGETTYHLPEDSSIASGFYNLKVQLPQHVTCTQCVLQWRYRTVLPDFDQSNLKTRYDGKYTDIAVACGLYFLSGMQGYATCEYRLMLMKHWPNGMAEVRNSWGVDENGQSGLGYGPQEEFYGCSDVSVTFKSTSFVLNDFSSSDTIAGSKNKKATAELPFSTEMQTIASTEVATIMKSTSSQSTSTQKSDMELYPDVDCNNEVTGQPIFRDCHSFFVCSAPQYDPFLFACPPGNVCDPIDGRCKHPRNVSFCNQR